MTSAPHPSAASRWKSVPLGTRILVALIVACVVTLLGFLINNPDVLHRVTGNGFKVGDCATVSPDLRGSRMDHVDCPTTGNVNLTKPVYRVREVREGKDAVCAGGPGGITFSNEPEDTTYCLTLAGLG